jgi:hypothetical protein
MEANSELKTKAGESYIPVYQYHAVQKDGWRFHYSTNPLVGQGWTFDHEVFKTPLPDTTNSVAVYQYHYDQSKTYGGWRFNYSLNPDLAEGWTKDKEVFYAFPKEFLGTIPVYQYHAEQEDGWRFHFSTNPNVTEGWTKDGIAFWVYD